MRRLTSLASLAAILIAVLLSPAALAQGREQIASYFSRVEVHEDNSVTVTEDITVDALGREIRRGIFRDIPLGGVGPLGLGGSSFELLAATRDGEPEPNRVERQGGEVRIYLGDAGTLLAPGRYRYRITYRMTDVVRHFADHDELYWNATGNGWGFDIREARVLVVPPEGAPVTDTSVYTGGFGARGADAVIGEDGRGRPVFTTVHALRPGEGITVSASWPKGHVAPPSASQRLAGWLERHGVYAVAVLTALLLAAYYGFAWLRVGRDPPAGTIIPVYHPTLPPAAMRYIERMGHDNECVSAALVSLAVKGRLRIEDVDGTTVLTRVHDAPSSKVPVSDGEQALLSALFLSGDEVTVEKAQRSRIRAATAALKSHLDRTFNRVYFNRNYLWFAGGAAITLAGIVLVVLISPVGAAVIAAAGMPILVAGFFANAFFRVVRDAWQAVRGGEYLRLALMAIPVAVLTIVLSSFVTIGGAFVFDIFSVGILPGLLIAFILGMNLMFFFLLKAPTAIGRGALDEIEGTRLYLTVAEADRLKFHNPPDKTPEHFHELLPYALALGVETAWTNQFRAEIAAAQAADPERDPYMRPGWYRGRGGRGFTNVREIGRIGPTMASAIAAASVTQSSSGSGGGGFSGGGSGGGGGGGW
ncbi:DUF2207 domain-containing protein [Lutibaculum baratangense]|uniref:Putative TRANSMEMBRANE SIGNAL PEPTIDE PROTEIN n=1 Tax=Lutibaculum baratangense AMV1 TaxID=631454 RepID=V4RHX8_9HYPH|nr:DUF2207 domain-containing protein [Lutibaculum baratangense]ESR25736.1 putative TRANSMEMBRANE SIGNAL PEPTIDE PROTEIN [Lutibaculum baratangense AMV1]